MGTPRCLLVVVATLAAPLLAIGFTTALAGCPPPVLAVSDDRDVSAGLWDVVAVEMNGRTLDAEIVKLLQIAYRADGSWAVLFKRRPIGEGTSRNDQTTSPKAFEMETLGGRKTKPRRYTGIYKLDGDSRQLCFVPAGMPRPDDFSAPRGSGRVLVTLKRAERQSPRAAAA